MSKSDIFNEVQVNCKSSNIPSEGFVRIGQIIGDKKRELTPVFPVSKSTWWSGVKTGKYPKPVKHGGSTFWRAEDIHALIKSVQKEAA